MRERKIFCWSDFKTLKFIRYAYNKNQNIFDFRKAKRKTLLLLRSEITPTYALLFFLFCFMFLLSFLSVHKRNAIICNHAEKQQQQQRQQMPNGRWPYNNLPFMQSGNSALTLPARGRGSRERGKQIADRFVSSFWRVLTVCVWWGSSTGGQGKARQGEKNVCQSRRQ